MFNQLQFSREQVLQATEALANESELHDPTSYAAQVIAHRLRNFPDSYLEFGPYWWSVKAALRAQGQEFGSADDDQIRAAYGAGLEPLEALVAGEMFKDYYRRHFFVGTAQFWLDDGAEESYVLFDSNMEARRLGPGALAVDANLAAQVEPENDEPPAA